MFNISNSKFFSNYAGKKGGAIYMDYTKIKINLNISNCTFDTNYAHQGSVLYAISKRSA